MFLKTGDSSRQEQNKDGDSCLVAPLQQGQQTCVCYGKTKCARAQTGTRQQGTAAARVISHGVSFPACVYQLTLRTWEREAEMIQRD